MNKEFISEKQGISLIVMFIIGEAIAMQIGSAAGVIHG